MSREMNRKRLRRCVVDAAESYADEKDFVLSGHVSDVIRHFDESASFISPADSSRFVSELRVMYPECEWSLFSTTLSLYLEDVLEEFPRQQLPAVEVSLLADGKSIESGRTSIGGAPNWIQAPTPEEEFPACASCSELMAFVCQVDSRVFDQAHKDVNPFKFADAGCIYVFVCLNCGETRAMAHSH